MATKLGAAVGALAFSLDPEQAESNAVTTNDKLEYRRNRP
jgi:hypothetical protein